MTWTEFELMARGGTLSLLALWCWVLWRDHRDLLAARLAIAMNLGIAAYIVVTAGWADTPNRFGLLFAIGAGTTPGLFWLFVRTWLNDRTRLDWREVALVALSVLNVLVMQLTYRTFPTLHLFSGALFRILMLGFAGAGLWEAWRGRAGDLVEGRRGLRLAIVVAVGLYVVVIALAEMAVFDGGAPRVIVAGIGASIVFVTLWFCAAMFGSRQVDLFGLAPAPSQNPAALLRDDDPLAGRLRAYMAAELPYRDEGLTIAALAARLGEQEYRLRRLINGSLGHRNFAQFLNGYRLAEVKAALADPAQREVPILTIALDAGFGSLGPFNRAFREAEGTTPSAFRSRALADSGIG